MSQPEIMQTISTFTSIEEALDYFEISYTQKFINEHRLALTKRFNGYLILEKPEDWFAARRALKNAYCKIQRSQLSKGTRQACRGCTTCQRR
ncbi:nitrogenase-stabilizing/protective protein NifW [Vibrio maerlii]|uniref:nitrogenase-stabilizing/protective protein NifW n=1 Tax=Vibrio maerlii TaxID=2231648 RepID=UPI000E3E4C65|nr:nitrogenase-stabilizing/protective protein NifW [Vibrio maerlii]